MTPKQARFVQEYLIDGNATQAAIRAGYSEKTAHAIGHENLSKPVIAEAIKVAQGEIAEKLGLTAVSIVEDVIDVRRLAKQNGVYASALKANEMLGKTLGKANPFADQPQEHKHEVEISGADALPELSRHVAFLLTSGMKAKEKQADSPPLH